MKTNRAGFAVSDSRTFKIKMLNWAARFNIFILLDNNEYSFEQPGFECMLAAGCRESVTLESGEGLEKLQTFYDANKSWIFGHFGYAVLQEKHATNKPLLHEVDFGDGFFFVPEILLTLHENEITIECTAGSPVEIFAAIEAQQVADHQINSPGINIQKGITEAAYKHTLATLQKHIHRGDCYEINFCQSFFANDVLLDPIIVYQKLAAISPSPFAAFYKKDDKYCLCASPERFLKKNGNTLISQPIKGTSKRDHTDELIDSQNKQHLLSSEKEKSENVMVVDLVRNDMSRICEAGSVRVKELFGVYSFPQVHQMISTIEGTVALGTKWTDIIKACFPMGSMTGAPKKKVMELIDRYESCPRGLFSGSIGYVTATGDFDFNVVIRSLMYDSSQKIISIKAGGGITFYSDANDEYEESLLKAAAIIKILNEG